MRDQPPLGHAGLRRVRLTVLLTMAAAAPLGAQVPASEPASPPPASPPPASPPPVDQPIAGGRPVPLDAPAQDSSSATGKQRSPWGFSIRAGEGWVRNPGAVPGGTAGSLVDRASVLVDYLHTGARGNIGVSGDAVVTRDHQFPDLSNVAGGGSVSLFHTLSPRASLTLADALQTRYAYESALLTGAGVLLGSVRTTSNVASAGLQYRLGSVTGLRVDARHEHVSFDSPVLVAGSQLAASATVTRRRSTVTGLAASYLFGASSGAARQWATHTGFASWRRRLGLHWTSGLSLGVTRSTRAGSNFPYAVGELGAVYGRTILSARFSNSVSQAYGAGYEQEMKTVGLNMRRQVSRRLTASLAGTYADSRAIATSGNSSVSGVGTRTPRYSTLQATGTVQVRLSRAFGLDMDAFTMRLRPRPGAALAAVTDTVTAGMGLALVYERPLR